MIGGEFSMVYVDYFFIVWFLGYSDLIVICILISWFNLLKFFEIG